jgi:hypothetical protein
MIVNITPGTPLGQPVTENFLRAVDAGQHHEDLANQGTELAQKLGKLSDQLNEVVQERSRRQRHRGLGCSMMRRLQQSERDHQ